tara:strand:+ start:5008 stop:6381 length:1374 start_codon:yes stop_codon:yes gene_type:complete
MDQYTYTDSTLKQFMRKNMFFNDPVLERYYERGDIKSFRSRLIRSHKNESLEKILYAFITDLSRDIIMKTVGEITKFMNPMGDVIISGGEAYNYYVDKSKRIVTSDIDTKFVPRIPYDSRYFGKLQAMKLLLWDKLGEISIKIQREVKSRLTTSSKLALFLGFKLSNKLPIVTRRYTLIKKKKEGNGSSVSSGDVLIDVELFALDLNIRSFSIESGKIEERTLGGFLDIPFMRPGEFGYEVIDSRRAGITYMDRSQNKLVTDKNMYIAGKKFLIDDLYLMQKLGLRPEKKIKDKQRMYGLVKMITGKTSPKNTIEKLFLSVQNTRFTPMARSKRLGRVNITAASKINPRKYEKYTTIPSVDSLSRKILFGKNGNSTNGFRSGNGNMRFNINKLRWVEDTSRTYIGNQYNLRPVDPVKINQSVLDNPPLYGYNVNRDNWVPKSILKRASLIPVIGLKK